MNILIDIRQTLFINKTPLKNFLETLTEQLKLNSDQIIKVLTDSLNKIDGQNQTIDDIFGIIYKQIEQQLQDKQTYQDFKDIITQLLTKHYKVNTNFLKKHKQFIKDNCTFIFFESTPYKQMLYILILVSNQVPFICNQSPVSSPITLVSHNPYKLFMSLSIPATALHKIVYQHIFTKNDTNRKTFPSLLKQYTQQILLQTSNLLQLSSVIKIDIEQNGLVRIGYFFSSLKDTQLQNLGFLQSFSNYYIFPIDFEQDVQMIRQSIDYLIQKQDLEMKANELPFRYTQQYMSNLKQLKASDIDMIDPMSSLSLIADRQRLHVYLQSYLQSSIFIDKLPKHCPTLYIPKSINLEGGVCVQKAIEMIKKEGLRYPLLMKPAQAFGSYSSHILTVCCQQSGLEEVLNGYAMTGLLCQELVEHYGVILKVYHLAPHTSIQQRPSIPRLRQHISHFSFDSQKSLQSQVPDCLDPLFVFQEIQIDRELISVYSRLIADYLGFTIFGLDFLRDEQNRYYVVDINYFPGFKNCENVEQQFQDCIVYNHEKRQKY